MSAIGFCGLRAFHRDVFFRRPSLVCSVIGGSIPMGRIFISTSSVGSTLLRGGIPRPRMTGRPRRGGIGGSVVRISLRTRRLLSAATNVDGDRVLGCRLSIFHGALRRYGGGGKRGVIFVRNGKSNILHGTVLRRLGCGCGGCRDRSTSFHRCNFKTAVIVVRWSFLVRVGYSVTALGRFLGTSHFTAYTKIRLLRVGPKCTHTYVRIASQRLGNKKMYRNNTLFALTSLTFTTMTGDHGGLALSIGTGVAFLHPTGLNCICTRTIRMFGRRHVPFIRMGVASKRKRLVTMFASSKCHGRSSLPMSTLRWFVVSGDLLLGRNGELLG